MESPPPISSKTILELLLKRPPPTRSRIGGRGRRRQEIKWTHGARPLRIAGASKELLFACPRREDVCGAEIKRQSFHAECRVSVSDRGREYQRLSHEGSRNRGLFEGY